MRLMLLGSEQTGKTSLLQAFKRESINMNNTQQNQRKVSDIEMKEMIYSFLLEITNNS
jgi:helix-turn-helix protein